VSDRPPPVLKTEGDVRSIADRDLALVFERVGDRWTHTIEVSRSLGAPRETIARAVEWDADRDDPARVAGPVFQELQFQTDPQGRPHALLLGMSGRHHFSAAFALVPCEGGISVSVDLADRCRDEVVAIGSTYTAFLHSGELLHADLERIEWDLGTRRLTFAAGASTSVGLGEAGRRATRVQATAVNTAGVSTRRWAFSWSLSNSSRTASN
jgi:hypothetical protein